MTDPVREAEERWRHSIAGLGWAAGQTQEVRDVATILQALTDLRERLTETEAKLDELRDLENARLGRYIEQDKRLSEATRLIRLHLDRNGDCTAPVQPCEKCAFLSTQEADDA